MTFTPAPWQVGHTTPAAVEVDALADALAPLLRPTAYREDLARALARQAFKHVAPPNGHAALVAEYARGHKDGRAWTEGHERERVLSLIAGDRARYARAMDYSAGIDRAHNRGAVTALDDLARQVRADDDAPPEPAPEPVRPTFMRPLQHAPLLSDGSPWLHRVTPREVYEDAVRKIADAFDVPVHLVREHPQARTDRNATAARLSEFPTAAWWEDEASRSVEVLRACPKCGTNDRTWKSPICDHRWHRQAYRPDEWHRKKAGRITFRDAAAEDTTPPSRFGRTGIVHHTTAPRPPRPTDADARQRADFAAQGVAVRQPLRTATPPGGVKVDRPPVDLPGPHRVPRWLRWLALGGKRR